MHINKLAAHNPLISVVMATYNHGKFLPRAIDSVLAQTFKDFEFIIVDDGSTDNTQEVLSHYEKCDQRIKIISQDNQGLASSRNNGVATARGKYIAFMDSDDACAINRLEYQLKFLQQNPALHACSCQLTSIEDYTSGLKVHDEIRASGVLDKNAMEEMLAGHDIQRLNPTTFITKESFTAIGGYRTQTTIIEDLDFSIRYYGKYPWAMLWVPNLYFYTFPHQSNHPGLSNQNLETFYQREIAGYISAWCRYKGQSDPVEEGKNLQEILAVAAQIPYKERGAIYWGQIPAFLNLPRFTKRSKPLAHWWVIRQLRYPLIPGLILLLGPSIKKRIKILLTYLRKNNS